MASVKLSPIPRIRCPAPEAFERDFVKPGLPAVLAGAIDGWPARRWSPRLLKERFGSARVRVYVLRGGRIQIDARRGFLLEEMPLGEYADYAEQASAVGAQHASVGRAEHASAEREVAGGACDEPIEVKWYLRSRLDSLPADLRKDVPVPDYCARGLGLRQNLWFAARGTVSQLHFDLPRNLVAQLHGRKRFILFSPRDSNFLYPCSFLSSTPHLSLVDPEKPSRAFPLFALARGFCCTLEPGDMLFIPPRWWHHARALDASIAVNFWWSSAAIYPFVLASDAYKLVRGLNI